MSGDMSLQAGDGISLTTADSPKPSRTLDVLSHAIPFFGPFLALKTSVSYKAITDALQLYGIIDGLLLSIAFGALGGGQPSGALTANCGRWCRRPSVSTPRQRRVAARSMQRRRSARNHTCACACDLCTCACPCTCSCTLYRTRP